MPKRSKLNNNPGLLACRLDFVSRLGHTGQCGPRDSGSLRWASLGDIVEGLNGRRALKRSRRRLPYIKGGRPITYDVSVSVEENARLDVLATEGRVTIQRLLVESALAGSRPTVTVGKDQLVALMEIRRVLAGVANNANQIARHANTTSEVPAEFAAMISEVRTLGATIASVVDRYAK